MSLEAFLVFVVELVVQVGTYFFLAATHCYFTLFLPHYRRIFLLLNCTLIELKCRFIDISRDQKLHLWKSDSAEISFSSLVSAICSSGSDKPRNGSLVASSSWIAAGLSSGYCRLLDERSGKIIAVWRAHDGHITKVCQIVNAPTRLLSIIGQNHEQLLFWYLTGSFLFAHKVGITRGPLDCI